MCFEKKKEKQTNKKKKKKKKKTKTDSKPVFLALLCSIRQNILFFFLSALFKVFFKPLQAISLFPAAKDGF